MTENERVANESAPTDGSVSYKPQEATKEVLAFFGFRKLILYAGSRLWQVEDYDITYYHDLEINFYNHLYVLAELYTKHTGKAVAVQHRETDYSNAVYLNGKLVFYLHIASEYDSKEHEFKLWVYKEQYLDEIKAMLQELLDTIPLDELKPEFDSIYQRENAKINLVDIEKFDREFQKYIIPYALLSSKEKAQYENEKKEFIEALKNDKEFAEKEVLFIIIPDFFGESYRAEKTGLKLRDLLNKSIDSIQVYQNLLVLETPTRRTFAVELSENEKQKILEIVNSTEYMKWLPHTGYWGGLLGWDKGDYVKDKPKQ